MVVVGGARRARRRPGGAPGRSRPRGPAPEAALLASFARTVLTRTDPLPRLLEKVREAFGLRSVALLERSRRAATSGRCVASSGPPGCAGPGGRRRRRGGRGRTCTSSAPAGRCAAADRRLLEVVGGQALLALRSQRAAAAGRRVPAPRRGDRDPQRAALGRRARPAQPADLDQGRRRQPARPAPARCPPPTARELTATIEESADRLTALVDNLLDSSRLAAGAVDAAARARSGTTRSAARALVGLDGRRPGDGRHRRDAPRRRSPTPGCWNGWSRTSSTTRCATRPARPIVLRASAYADRVELRIVDSGPGVPRADAGRAVRRRSSGSAARSQRPRRRDRRRARAVGRAGLHRGHGRHADRGGHPGRRPHGGRLAARRSRTAAEVMP